LSQGLKPQKSKASLPVKWIALTAVIVIGIVALVFVVRSENQPSENGKPSLDALYIQAQTAVEENDIAEANKLLDQRRAFHEDKTRAFL